jgi:hypothetical protein
LDNKSSALNNLCASSNSPTSGHPKESDAVNGRFDFFERSLEVHRKVDSHFICLGRDLHEIDRREWRKRDS